MTARAPLCSFASCKLHTKHASGRCPHHRWGASAARLTGPGGIPTPTPSSGRVVTSRFERLGDQTKEIYTDADGRIHREDGPAVIFRRPDGSVEGENYVQLDELFRPEGGPVMVGYHRNGKVARETWGNDNGYSRIDGPAWVLYDEQGKLIEEIYYLAGVSLPGPDAHAARLGMFDRDVLTREVTRSSYTALVDAGIPLETVTDALSAGVTTFEGIREVANGAPAEWVRSYEEGSR